MKVQRKVAQQGLKVGEWMLAALGAQRHQDSAPRGGERREPGDHPGRRIKQVQSRVGLPEEALQPPQMRAGQREARPGCF
ncbi:hypothetical protein GCM10010840_13090 [Deinococcus aerolatus]|uniref:Uncharacterized protein n=1 Tax=Deinococcus aerolatus TaxID=522487 RepID=A0ABQ2G5D3_9DEIO|nr:hypothetical protein GCM10010840_13090 [Deinococcus aerolatus]